MFYAILTNDTNDMYETDKFHSKNDLVKHVNELCDKLKNVHNIKEIVMFSDKLKIGRINVKQKNTKQIVREQKRRSFLKRRELKSALIKWQNSTDIVGHAWRRNKILYALDILKSRGQLPLSIDKSTLYKYNPKNDEPELFKSVEVWRLNKTGELAYLSRKLRPKFIIPVIKAGEFVRGYDSSGREYSTSILPSPDQWEVTKGKG